MAVAEISKNDVRQALVAIRNGKTARNRKSGKLRGRSIVTGGPGTAKRTAGLIQTILTSATDLEIISVNPAFGLRLPADNRRRVEDVETVYSALGRAIELGEQQGENWRAIAIIRLIVLTGLRRQEAVGLKWDEIDFNERLLKLENTKTGASERPIGIEAHRLLQKLNAERSNDEFVFPAIRSKIAPYGGLPSAWKRITGTSALGPSKPDSLERVVVVLTAPSARVWE